MRPGQMRHLDLLAHIAARHPQADLLKLSALSRDSLLAWLRRRGHDAP